MESVMAQDKESGVEAPIETIIRKVLERHTRVRLAILYGSLASGHARRESDLDLAVDTGEPLGAEEKMALIGDLAQEIGRPVDLVDLCTAGEPLLGQIITRGRRVMGSDMHYAEMIRKHVFDAADFMPYRTRILSERRQGWIGK
jgi:predicted nucleotidyltransferase